MNESGADAATAAEDDGNERASERAKHLSRAAKKNEAVAWNFRVRKFLLHNSSECYFTYFPLIGCLLVKGVRISYEPIEISDYAGRQEKLSCLYKLRAERKPRSKE